MILYVFTFVIEKEAPHLLLDRPAESAWLHDKLKIGCPGRRFSSMDAALRKRGAISRRKSGHIDIAADVMLGSSVERLDARLSNYCRHVIHCRRSAQGLLQNRRSRPMCFGIPRYIQLSVWAVQSCRDVFYTYENPGACATQAFWLWPGTSQACRCVGVGALALIATAEGNLSRFTSRKWYARGDDVACASVDVTHSNDSVVVRESHLPPAWKYARPPPTLLTWSLFWMLFGRLFITLQANWKRKWSAVCGAPFKLPSNVVERSCSIDGGFGDVLK